MTKHMEHYKNWLIKDYPQMPSSTFDAEAAYLKKVLARLEKKKDKAKRQLYGIYIPFAPKTHKTPSPLAKRESRERYDRTRPSSSARGYDNSWQAVRRYFLANNPLCIDCLKKDNRYFPAQEVHHIEPLRDNPSRRDDPANLAPLCKRHHSIRTAKGE